MFDFQVFEELQTFRYQVSVELEEFLLKHLLEVSGELFSFLEAASELLRHHSSVRDEVVF